MYEVISRPVYQPLGSLETELVIVTRRMMEKECLRVLVMQTLTRSLGSGCEQRRLSVAWETTRVRACVRVGAELSATV